MKKTIAAISLVVIFTLVMSACSKNQFMDISGFVNSYNRVADKRIEYENIYSYTDEDRIVFEIFFGADEPTVVLKLIANNDRITSLRIAAAKIDENGSEKPVSTETVSEFITVAKNSIMAFCGFEVAEAEQLLQEFGLYKLQNYGKKGELTKTKDSFYFVYFSDSIICDFIITNTFLEKIEKTEKPESKPAFGNTTKIRTETAASE